MGDIHYTNYGYDIWLADPNGEYFTGAFSSNNPFSPNPVWPAVPPEQHETTLPEPYPIPLFPGDRFWGQVAITYWGGYTGVVPLSVSLYLKRSGTPGTTPDSAYAQGFINVMLNGSEHLFNSIVTWDTQWTRTDIPVGLELDAYLWVWVTGNIIPDYVDSSYLLGGKTFSRAFITVDESGGGGHDGDWLPDTSWINVTEKTLFLAEEKP